MMKLSFRFFYLYHIIPHYIDIFKYYFRFLSLFTPNMPPIAPLSSEIASFIMAAVPISAEKSAEQINAARNITPPQSIPVSIPRRLKLFAATNPAKNDASIKSPAESGFISENGISFSVITNEKSNSRTDDAANPIAVAFIIVRTAKKLFFSLLFAMRPYPQLLFIKHIAKKRRLEQKNYLAASSLGVVLATTALLRIRILTRSLPVSITMVSSLRLTTLPMIPP